MIEKGIDSAPENKYQSMNGATHTDQANVKAKKASEHVGVTKLDDTYKKPTPPEIVNKFWGVSNEETDEIVNEKELANATNTFFGVDPNKKSTKSRKQPETEEDANNKFFAVEDKPELKRGDPIPGYSGFNRRIAADNVFGMSYGEAKRRAHESDQKINHEKRETLKMNSTYMPPYKRPKEDEELI